MRKTVGQRAAVEKFLGKTAGFWDVMADPGVFPAQIGDLLALRNGTTQSTGRAGLLGGIGGALRAGYETPKGESELLHALLGGTGGSLGTMGGRVGGEMGGNFLGRLAGTGIGAALRAFGVKAPNAGFLGATIGSGVGSTFGGMYGGHHGTNAGQTAASKLTAKFKTEKPKSSEKPAREGK
jgi:hypothetical protein